MDPITDAPDWSQHHEEVLCPLCEYNLRGLSEPRCPECGFASDWRELTDLSRRRHPYLFEHHPRRNVWSFFQTMTNALRPRRFWKLLSPAQPVHLRRLILYWAIAMSLVLLVLMPEFAIETSQFAASVSSQRMRPFAGVNWSARYASKTKWLDSFLPLPPQPRFFLNLFYHSQLVRSICSLAVVYIAWAWVAFAILMIFQISLRRARIKPTHVLRCTVYSGDCGIVFVAAIAFVVVMAIRQIVVFLPAFPIRELAWWTAMLILWGGITFRLIRAYQLYLRFPHAAAVVVSVQVIFFLLMAEVLTLTVGYRGIYDALFMR